MKRRLMSLVLVLSLLLSLLPAVAAPLAADARGAALAEEALEESSEEVIIEEFPAEEAPAAESPDEEASAEELPGEPAPEEPFAGETPESGASPEGEAPEPLEGEDLFQLAALGSDGVQYAGVAYLSQAAFNSMRPEVQSAYVQKVDWLTDMLDQGVVIYHPIFSLDADGTLWFDFAMPIESASYGGALSEEAAPEEPELIEEAEAAPEEPELIEEAEAAPEEPEPVPEESAEEAEPAPEDAAEGGPIVENVELAESVRVPLQTIRSASSGKSFGIRQMNSEGSNLRESFFCKQLSENSMKVYNIAKANMIEQGKNGFILSSEDLTGSREEIHTAVNALLFTYRNELSWAKFPFNMNFTIETNGKERYTIATVDKSPHYSEKLERDAQKKVDELVEEARSYAQRNYPEDTDYGKIYYFDDWLCKNNNYVKGLTEEDWPTEIFYNCHTCYGALLKGYGVCEGYARAMCRLLDAAGIANIVVYGNGKGGREWEDHTWNYVRMPDGKYYLEDSTYNDTGKTKEYLLMGESKKHLLDPKGGVLTSLTFEFPTLSKSSYDRPLGALTFERDIYYIAKGKNVKIQAINPGYKEIKQTWTSGNKKIAALISGQLKTYGKVKGVAPGQTRITVSAKEKTASFAVRVYQFSGLTFSKNSKASLSESCDLDDGVLRVALNVGQKNWVASAQDICAGANLAGPAIKSSKPKVADISARLGGDTIVLSIAPKKLGSTTIKVSFGGKSAKLKLKVGKKLQGSWFELPYSTTEYTGKAIKPKVSKTSQAPKDLKYKVSYRDNKAVGTATVEIRGTGNYMGTVVRFFQIRPRSCDGKLSCKLENPVPYYIGKPQPAKLTIKLNGKKLKQGTDFEVRYNGSLNAPTDMDIYELEVRGKNYSFYLDSEDIGATYTIQPVPLSKLKVSLKSKVLYNGCLVTPDRLKLKVKYGSHVLPASDYTITYYDERFHGWTTTPSEPATFSMYIRPSETGNICEDDKLSVIHKKFKIY